MPYPETCPTCAALTEEECAGPSSWCEACQAALSEALTEALRAGVRAGGPCITCCEARATVDELFCVACYAELLLAQADEA